MHEDTARPLILASSSPRRRELMEYMGIPFVAVAADVDEHCEGDPAAVVRELACRKARAVACMHPGEAVLAADTLVYIDGRTLGKPEDEARARAMLRLLSDAWHEVHTGVCLAAGGETRCCGEVSRVRFAKLTDASIARYVRTGEPMDKAGAYALQGRGGMFVREIRGSYSNVIGLPMATVRDMLMQAGWEL